MRNTQRLPEFGEEPKKTPRVGRLARAVALYSRVTPGMNPTSFPLTYSAPSGAPESR
jgi:hypothetical protein